MKIAIYSHSIPSSLFIENLIEGLAQRGFKVYLFGKKLEEKSYGKNIFVKSTPKGNWAINWFIFGQSLLLFVRNPMVLIKTYRLVFSKNRMGIVQTKLSCFLPILNNPVDIFHFQWGNDLTKHQELFTLLKCDIFVSMRGSHFTYAPVFRKPLSDAYRTYFPKVKKFHAVSESMRQNGEKWGAAPERITAIYSSIPDRLIGMFKPFNRSIESPVKIVSIGRFHWVKGYNYALEAVHLLKQKGVQVKYTLVANENVPEELLYAIHSLGLSREVAIVNGLPHEETINLLQTQDILLMCSVAEGLANVVLEAMAVGIPVISTDCGGMAEVMKDGETGLLIPIRNPEAIAKAISNMQAMPAAELSQLTKKAHQAILQKHTLGNMLNRFEKLYKNP